MRKDTKVESAGRWIAPFLAAATIGAGAANHPVRLTQASGADRPVLAAMTAAASDCSTDTTLCLGEGRFLVEAIWTKPDGESGPAHAVALTTDSGYFWFLDANNVEVAVKALDGCAVNGHSWIFSAGLTNLAVTMTVTDMATNKSQTYSNLQGTPFKTVADTMTFAACPAGAESMAAANPVEPGDSVIVAPKAVTTTAQPDSGAGCVGNDTALCLSGRFQVRATWQTASGSSGAGHAANLTSESGYFWFFDPSNVELIVKALDACSIGSGQWFFSAGMTTIGVQLTVTDTSTGEVKSYGNTPDGETPGVAFVPILDTAAFRHCLRTVALEAADESCWTGSFIHMQFSPSPIHVRVGDTVIWAFQGGAYNPSSHSITSGAPSEPDGKWDSGIQNGSFTFSRTFAEAGTFPYYCRVGHLVPNWCLPPDGNPNHRGQHSEEETGVVIVDP